MRNVGRASAVARPVTALVTVFVTAVGSVLVAGCGSSTGPGAGPTGVPPSSSTNPSTDPTTNPSSSTSKHPGPGPQDPSVPPSEDAANLTIVYSADGTAQQTWTLTCAPNGGTHPDPAAACAALAAAGTTPFSPVPTDQQCTQIYGGPQTAMVRGTWRGEAIMGAFSRTNGCQIERWGQLEGLLPAV